jgi:hypothetical protein
MDSNGQMCHHPSTTRIDLSERKILTFVVDCLSIMTSQRARSCAPIWAFIEYDFEPKI